MYFHSVVGTGRYTTSTTNMYNKDRFHVPQPKTTVDLAVFRFFPRGWQSTSAGETGKAVPVGEQRRYRERYMYRERERPRENKETSRDTEREQRNTERTKKHRENRETPRGDWNTATATNMKNRQRGEHTGAGQRTMVLVPCASHQYSSLVRNNVSLTIKMSNAWMSLMLSLFKWFKFFTTVTFNCLPVNFPTSFSHWLGK